TNTVSKKIDHKVQRGETLSSIAKMYDLSVNTLKELNNIEGSKINVNQIIKVKADEQVYSKSETRSRYTAPVESKNLELDEEVSDNLIEVAKKYLGAPYKFGGNSIVTGIDCSAYVKKVYSFFDISLPRTARDIFKEGSWVTKSSLEKGDLVFFRTYAQFPSHVGIYIGNDKFIHASSASRKVTITDLNQNYYQERYIGAKRIPIFDEVSNQL
ncbi:MAG: NlpC/P60 family protein, partial [Thermodesulfobacteriota bacterium]